MALSIERGEVGAGEDLEGGRVVHGGDKLGAVEMDGWEEGAGSRTRLRATPVTKVLPKMFFARLSVPVCAALE